MAGLVLAGATLATPSAGAASTSATGLYFRSLAAAGSADQLAAAAGSTATWVYNDTDTQTGWLELRDDGTSPAPKLTSAMPTPSGHGYLSDAVAGRTVSAGAWAPVVTLRGNGAVTVVPIVRFYRWSGGTYTLLGTSKGSSTRLGSTAVNLTLPAVSLAQQTFAPTDQLYVDLLAQVTKASCCAGNGVMHRVDTSSSSRLTIPALATTSATPTPTPTPTPTASSSPSPSSSSPTPSSSGVWQPKPGTSWQWQLTGSIDTSLPVSMYDIDLFDAQPSASSYSVSGFGTVNVPQGANAGVISTLHRQGKVVICYVSTGAWENWRPDAKLFPSDVLGNSNGWSGERWIDVRSSAWSQFEPLIAARFDLAKRSGCDGVEPDNNDPYGNNTGFSTSKADQKSWYLEVANLAHARGLSVGQKNGLDTLDADTVAAFDWALDEECRTYSECDVLTPYIRAGKAVFHVEYTEDGATTSFCPADNTDNFDGLLKTLDLTAWRQACR